jgi:sugar phosphate isomerase/epimerase
MDLDNLTRLEKLYDEKFRPLNSEFKKIATNWQMKSQGGEPVLNDHSDQEYDAKVINKLLDLHERVLKLSEELIPLYPEAKGYLKRLGEAVEKIKGGDHRYMTGVTVDSYHTVWYEFHYELLKKLGREGKLSEDEV